ncbi:MAG: DUF3175 domain-containing protein [Pseudomonadota bacterium]
MYRDEASCKNPRMDFCSVSNSAGQPFFSILFMVFTVRACPDQARQWALAGEQSRKWSPQVTETSRALDLEHGLLSLDDPRAIAESLKRSTERSDRRKAVKA